MLTHPVLAEPRNAHGTLTAFFLREGCVPLPRCVPSGCGPWRHGERQGCDVDGWSRSTVCLAFPLHRAHLLRPIRDIERPSTRRPEQLTPSSDPCPSAQPAGRMYPQAIHSTLSLHPPPQFARSDGFDFPKPIPTVSMRRARRPLIPAVGPFFLLDRGPQAGVRVVMRSHHTTVSEYFGDNSGAGGSVSSGSIERRPNTVGAAWTRYETVRLRRPHFFVRNR